MAEGKIDRHQRCSSSVRELHALDQRAGRFARRVQPELLWSLNIPKNWSVHNLVSELSVMGSK